MEAEAILALVSGKQLGTQRTQNKSYWAFAFHSWKVFVLFYFRVEGLCLTHVSEESRVSL